jgi:hypothetical protein
MMGMFLGLLLAWAIAAAIPYLDENSSARTLRKAYDRVEVGDDAERAAAQVLGGIAGQLVFGSVDRWLISDKPRLFQDHWVLEVCIADGKVVGKRVGIADDLTVAPAGAPEPVGSCSPK